MKKMLLLVLVMVYMFSVSACNNSTEKIEGNIVLPTLNVELEDKEIEAFTGSHSWLTENYGINADFPHPLNNKDNIPMITTNDITALLNFDNEPDKISVKCWSDNSWNNTSAESEQLIANGYELTLKDGGHIYEIIAEWDKNNKPSGSICYYFYAVVDTNNEQAKTDIINQSLKEGEEILVNSGFEWKVSEKEVKAVLDKISSIMQMKYIDIADGNYDIAIYSIKTDTSASPRLFILNADSSELIFYLNLDKTLYSDILNMLN